MSLRNGMWHGLRNDIIMWNVIYTEWPKEIDLTEKCTLFWRQSICKHSCFFNVDIRWQSKSHEGSLSISLFRTATKILLAFISRAAWQHRYYRTKVGHNCRKDVLEGHAPFYFNFFMQKMFAPLTLEFLFTYICICNRVKSVSFSNGGLRDRDIIFRDETDLLHVLCFFSCLVKFPAREASSWRRRASPNPGNWVCVFFSPSYHFSIFSRSNAHTHSNKEGSKTRGKAKRRQRAVRFTRFLDYRLMFDSWHSFSLKNDLIRPSY